METIVSRKNPKVQHLRKLASERGYRRKCGEFVCDGAKLLEEALQNRMVIRQIFYRENAPVNEIPGVPGYVLSADVFDHASPLENSPGPLFTVAIPKWETDAAPERVIVLENVQDPGNIGTVIRSAAALGIDYVMLVGSCADPYNTKTVRGAMGALFRQKLIETDAVGLSEQLRSWKLPLYGAALASDSEDIRSISLYPGAVAIGNEGKGLTDGLLALCDRKLIIPMTPGSESFNAGVAASIVMWEMSRSSL